MKLPVELVDVFRLVRSFRCGDRESSLAKLNCDVYGSDVVAVGG